MYEPIKKLGQNFLTDKNLAEEFVDNLNICDGDTVIEIGAGLGAVTEILANVQNTHNFKLYVLEIDARFSAKLEDMYSDYGNIIVVETDALKWLPHFESAGVLKVIGSLPFYITSPLIHSIIKMRYMPEVIDLIVQKEVAKKIAAKAPDSSYFSVFVQTFYDVIYKGEIPRKKFDPQPNVDGGVLSMVRRTKAISPEILDKYEGFLHKSFSHPRKMLNKIFKTEELAKGEILPTLRAEALSADRWFAFFKILNNIQD
jgi:16S rRNA (adenine1518-N6/adenine1519-N6)-dimethyltransferase